MPNTFKKISTVTVGSSGAASISFTNIPQTFTDLKIVMSGFRDKNIENKIIENGGEITASVSKNTNILIIKDKSIMDTSKVIKAKELGITIMTIDEFNKFI